MGASSYLAFPSSSSSCFIRSLLPPAPLASTCSWSWAFVVATRSSSLRGCLGKRPTSNPKIFRTFCSNKMAGADFSKIECVNFDVLWEQAASEMSNIMHHPFILSTITGTLPLSALAKYLQDEAYILTAVSQLLSNQPVSTSLIKLSNYVQNLRKFSCNGEMQEISGDHLSDITQVSVSAKEFKAFLLEQALSGDSLKVVLSSLVILQARKVLESTIADHIPLSGKGTSVYQLWISGYSNSELQISAALLAEELDTELSQNIVTADQLNQLEYAISTTLGHQLRVFDSASAGSLLMMGGKCLNSSRWYAHRLLFTTDYDVTCTVKDTGEILVALADAALKRDSLEVNGGVESLDRGQFIERDLMAVYWSLLDVHDQRIKECLADLQNVSLNNNFTQQSIEMMASIATGNADEIRDMDALYMLPGMDPKLERLVKLAQDYLKIAGYAEGKPGRVQKRLAYDDSGLREVLKLLGGLEKKVNQCLTTTLKVLEHYAVYGGCWAFMHAHNWKPERTKTLKVLEHYAVYGGCWAFMHAHNWKPERKKLSDRRWSRSR
ncbi:hypothetical protein O6H91_04G066900 [Diphasiastrum complanatum]|uniref:Uncharacterized protein n=2 Tax=Diphasiastrum complanatum TaxID=34168 RepID=A0ACC2DY78_DIPCM|nr:hypothetical protein O6H91_04G066900 [Diphasiastrum complanatum]KAJ7559042.1 hypothetical protein O6H91_04G066900 [Diphasiastrum complanatum]